MTKKDFEQLLFLYGAELHGAILSPHLGDARRRSDEAANAVIREYESLAAQRDEALRLLKIVREAEHASGQDAVDTALFGSQAPCIEFIRQKVRPDSTTGDT